MAKNKKNLQLLTIDDLCTLLVCSRTHIYNMLQICTLPKPVHIDGMTRWRQTDIEKWLLTKQQENKQNIESEVKEQL